jgi:hypothetical protein
MSDKQNLFFLKQSKIILRTQKHYFLNKDVFIALQRTMERLYIGKVCKGYCMSRQLYVLTAWTCIGRNDCYYIRRECKEANRNVNVLINLRWRQTCEIGALYSYYKVIKQVTHFLLYLQKYYILLVLVSVTM